jgi:AraC-like DNA-binding protein
MVCSRCKLVVKSELEKLGLRPISVELGEVELENDTIENQKEELLKRMHSLGFDLIDDKKSKIIERIKNLIIELIYSKNNELSVNLSDYLAQDLLQDYSSLSNLFSEVESITIEHYFISQKIERVKELLTYDELSLSEIAFQLNYSSVAHLSNQFKKITGLTPTHFKKLKGKKRQQIEDL